MNKISNELKCKVTTGVVWVMCPVCGHGKILKLTEQTRAAGLVLFCRRCKHESVVDIVPGGGGHGFPRAYLAAGGTGNQTESA